MEKNSSGEIVKVSLLTIPAYFRKIRGFKVNVAGGGLTFYPHPWTSMVVILDKSEAYL